MTKTHVSPRGVPRETSGGEDGPAALHPAAAAVGFHGLGEGVLLSILDSLVDGVVVADTDGRFVFFNPAAERMVPIGALDRPQADWPAAYGCFREDGVTPYSAEDLPIARASRGETLHDRPLLIRSPRTPEGMWLSIDASPVLDELGSIRGGVIVFRDVTAKRRAEERAHVLSAAVEQTADCVFITNGSGVIEYVNPAVAGCTGYSAEELIGETPRVFRSGEHTPEFWTQMWARLLGGETFRGTIANRKKSGEIYYSQQTITPIRNGSGTVSRFVSVAKDITEIRKAALRDSKLQLARDVQQRLLPPAPSPACGLDMAGGALMADETGGDFYDFIPLDDGRMALAIGDVSGHAFDAALVMARIQAQLRSIARAHADPSRILALLNQATLEDVLDNQYATALIMSIDRAAGAFIYASAGHITGYALDPHGTILAALESTGIPLGLFPHAGHTSRTVQGFLPGSLAVLLTDGVMEAENADGLEFGSERALEVVRSTRDLPADQIVKRLQSAVREFAAGGIQRDDITVVVCRVL